jgi:hypothetical protein
MRTRSGLFIALLLSAGSAHGQAVRGVVITPDSAFVPGVIVTLLDSKGTPVARALADDGGAFMMRAPASGLYHIEAKRLAFRPTLDAPVYLEEGKIRLHNVVLTGAPVQLAGVSVTADQQCRANPDSESAAFAVWEEVRKALRSSQLTRMTRAYRADITTYVRHQSAAEQRWRTTDSTLLTDMPLKPFASLPAEQLAEQGYLTRGAKSETFHAPDEDVLLSDVFAATHCLRILPDSGGDNTVRLGFSPVPNRKQTEISGVLTIDRATSELRRLDFSFVNVPAMDFVGSPGGEIVFRHLPEGSWLIEQWAIWLPVAETRTDIPVDIPSPNTRVPVRRAPANITTRFGMQTTGGHVTRVVFGDETIWMSPTTRLP